MWRGGQGAGKRTATQEAKERYLLHDVRNLRAEGRRVDLRPIYKDATADFLLAIGGHSPSEDVEQRRFARSCRPNGAGRGDA